MGMARVIIDYKDAPKCYRWWLIPEFRKYVDYSSEIFYLLCNYTEKQQYLEQ